MEQVFDEAIAKHAVVLEMLAERFDVVALVARGGPYAAPPIAAVPYLSFALVSKPALHASQRFL